jgi:hypothetical protein
LFCNVDDIAEHDLSSTSASICLNGPPYLALKQYGSGSASDNMQIFLRGNVSLPRTLNQEKIYKSIG